MSHGSSSEVIQLTPAGDTSGLAPLPPLVERLRAELSNAPEFEDDAAEHSEAQAHYRAGHWPGTEATEGKILAEQLVPAAELVDANGNREFGMSRAINRYMETSSLVSHVNSPLGAALHSLGFNGAKYALDSRDSTLLAVAYPSTNGFNERLRTTGSDAVGLEPSAAKDYSVQTEVQALAEGHFPVRGAYDMTMRAPALGLLAPEVLQLLRTKAKLALSANAQPSELAVPGTPELDVADVELNMRCIDMRMLSRPLLDAISETLDGQVYPSKIDDLGFHLRDLVSVPGSELPDNGRQLAELTLTHILALSQSQ